jgi:hypothetical protein
VYFDTLKAGHTVLSSTLRLHGIRIRAACLALYSLLIDFLLYFFGCFVPNSARAVHVEYRIACDHQVFSQSLPVRGPLTRICG